MSQEIKVLTEVMDSSSIEYLIESNEQKEKTYRIRGPFIMCEQRNRNGRMYPKRIVKPQVDLYIKDFVIPRRSLGSLDHPTSPALLYKNSAILTESLVEDGNNYNGVAKVLNTPDGIILKALMDDKITISVSTRGLGTLNSEGVVNDNFKFITTDAVIFPSAMVAVTESLIENYNNNEYYVDENEKIVQIAVKELKKELDVHGQKNLASDLKKFISSLSKKY